MTEVQDKNTDVVDANSEDLEDRELMTKVIDGDKHHWDLFCEKYYIRTYWMLFKICRNSSWHTTEDDILDICQDVWTRILKGVKNFDVEKPVGPWLKTIASRCFYDWASQKNKEPESISLISSEDTEQYFEPVSHDPDPEENANASDSTVKLLEKVIAFLNKKKPKTAILFQMIKLLQLNPKEVVTRVVAAKGLSETEINNYFSTVKEKYFFDTSKIIRDYFSAKLSYQDVCILLIVGGAREKGSEVFSQTVFDEISSVNNKEISDIVRKVNNELVSIIDETR